MLNHVVSDDTQQYWVNGNWTYVLEHDDDFSKQEYVMKVINSCIVCIMQSAFGWDRGLTWFELRNIPMILDEVNASI